MFRHRKQKLIQCIREEDDIVSLSSAFLKQDNRGECGLYVVKTMEEDYNGRNK